MAHFSDNFLLLAGESVTFKRDILPNDNIFCFFNNSKYKDKLEVEKILSGLYTENVRTPIRKNPSIL
jgi:hypothetical protein